MNRPWNANAKHIYMLHRASGMYPQYKDQNYQYGRWKDDYINGRPKSVTGIGPRKELDNVKRPYLYKKTPGLVKGRIDQKEPHRLTSDPCKLEFDSLIDCMRSNGYDNVHCTREVLAYTQCSKAAAKKFEADQRIKDNAPRNPLPTAVDKLRPQFDAESWSVSRTMMKGSAWRSPYHHSPKEGEHIHHAAVNKYMQFAEPPRSKSEKKIKYQHS